MMVFWIAAAALVLAVLALLFGPYFMRAPAPASALTHRQLNAAIYRDQLTKLERDRAEDMLSDADYAQARTELQRRVIDESADERAAAATGRPLRLMVVVGLLLPLAALVMYFAIGNRDALVAQDKPSAVGQQDIERMVAQLQAKLDKEPGNLQGWAMLGRSYEVLGRTVEAEKAFDHAGDVMDGDAQMLAYYADIAATNAQGNFNGKPDQIIAKALKADPNNPMAQWLAGTSALRAGAYDRAIRIWENLASQLEPESDDARTLQGALNEAYAKVGRTPPRPARNAKTPSAAAGSGSVSGSVELDAALRSKLGPNDVLMVIAKVPGARMPVAVLRVRAQSFPASFTLDDTLAMNPQATLSAAGTVEVQARISHTGMAMPESGDLISAAQTVQVGAKGLRLQVDQVRP